MTCSHQDRNIAWKNRFASESAFFSIWGFSTFAVIFLFGMIGLQLFRNSETSFKATAIANNIVVAGYQNLSGGEQNSLNIMTALLQGLGYSGFKAEAGEQTDESSGAIVNLTVYQVGEDVNLPRSSAVTATFGLPSESLAANLLGDATTASVSSASQASSEDTYVSLYFDNSGSTTRPLNADRQIAAFYQIAGLSVPADLTDEPPVSLANHMPYRIIDYSGLNRPWRELPQFNQFLTNNSLVTCNGTPWTEAGTCTGVQGEISQSAKWYTFRSDARREYLSAVINATYNLAEYTNLFDVYAFGGPDYSPIWDGQTSSDTADLNTGVLKIKAFDDDYQTPQLFPETFASEDTFPYNQPVDGTFEAPSNLFNDAVPMSNHDYIAKYYTSWSWEVARAQYAHILDPETGAETYPPGTFSALFDPPRSTHSQGTEGMPFPIFPNYPVGIGQIPDWEEGPAFPSDEWITAPIKQAWNRLTEYNRCFPLCSSATPLPSCVTYASSTVDCSALLASPVTLFAIPAGFSMPVADVNAQLPSVAALPPYVDDPSSAVGYAGKDVGKLYFDAGSKSTTLVAGGLSNTVSTAPFARATTADLINSLDPNGSGSRLDLAVDNAVSRCSAVRDMAKNAGVSETVNCVVFLITDGQLSDATLSKAEMLTNIENSLGQLTDLNATVFTWNIRFVTDIESWLQLLSNIMDEGGGIAVAANSLFPGNAPAQADLTSLWNDYFLYDSNSPGVIRTTAELESFCSSIAAGSNICADSRVQPAITLRAVLYSESAEDDEYVQQALALLNSPSNGRFLASQNFVASTSQTDILDSVLRDSLSGILLATKADPKVSARS